MSCNPTPRKRYEGEDVLRTPNRECPTCQAMKWHTEEQWRIYHPKRGTGIDSRTAPQK
jgi:hypothetical protein